MAAVRSSETLMCTYTTTQYHRLNDHELKISDSAMERSKFMGQVLVG
jgi:hypothetical protein